jgi:ABC-2 type transport system ATP-binding protein
MGIKINSLSKHYNGTDILKNISLEVKSGSVFGLLGPNGAGKTTLVSILNYLIPKNSGEIEIYGYDFDKYKSHIKSISSYIPQTYAFYPNLTIYENLEFFGALYGLKNDLLKKQISYAIEITSLENFANKKANILSGGVKRRLNIAIGLLNSPKIIYLDEPTVGIDPQSRQYILDTIKNINHEHKTTIIYTSHYMEEVEYICDEIAILDNQQIILQTSKDKLLQQTSMVQIQLAHETISVDISAGYEIFLATCKRIQASGEPIIDINFAHKNLEQMFLSLTKKELRD